MMTSRCTALSPDHRRGGQAGISRHRVTSWTQRTPYPAAAGLHSEVGPAARCLQDTGRQQLTASLSALHGLHHKELRRLHQQRTVLRASMLAYVHRMRDISSGRLLDDAHSPTSPHNSNNNNNNNSCSNNSSNNSSSSNTNCNNSTNTTTTTMNNHNSSNNNCPASGPRFSRDSSKEGSSQRKASTTTRSSSDSEKTRGTRTNTGQGNPDGTWSPNKIGGHLEGKGKRGQTRPRISVDSGIDVTEAWVEEGSEVTGRRHGSLPAIEAPSSTPPHRPRPASFHTTGEKEIQEDPGRTEEDSERKLRPASHHITHTAHFCGQRAKDVSSETVYNAPCKNRQRRAGTSENPNLLPQKLSGMHSHRRGSQELEVHDEHLSSLPDTAVAFPSISPFPQFGEASETEAAEEGTLGIPVGSKTHAQAQSPIPLSPSKLKGTKEQYWSVKKKTSTGRRVPVRHVKSVSQRLGHPPPSFSPRHGRVFRNGKKAKDSAEPTRDNFLRSFRYSDAVENLLKSFEDCTVDSTEKRHVRQAAELLPTLDLEDLREERTRLTQQRNTRKQRGRGPASRRSAYPDAARNDDTSDVRDDDMDEFKDDVIDYVRYGDIDGVRDDDRSDYGSDDGNSIESFVSSQGQASDEEEGSPGAPREGGLSPEATSADDEDREAGGERDGRKVPARRAVRVSFCLPTLIDLN